MNKDTSMLIDLIKMDLDELKKSTYVLQNFIDMQNSLVDRIEDRLRFLETSYIHNQEQK